MTGYSSIVRYKFRAGLILGFLAAIAILMTDFTLVNHQGKTDTELRADQEQDRGDESSTQLTASKDLVATVSQLTIQHAWHFIADIYTVDHEDQDTRGFDVREYDTWFRTLFRLIISPNAP